MHALTVPVEFMNRLHLPKVCPYTGTSDDLIPHWLETRYIPWWLWGLHLGELLLAARHHHAVAVVASHESSHTNISGIWVHRRLAWRLTLAQWLPWTILVVGLAALAVAGLVLLRRPIIAESNAKLIVAGLLGGGLLVWLIAGLLGSLAKPATFRAQLQSNGQYVDLYFADPAIHQAYDSALDLFRQKQGAKEAAKEADYAAAAEADLHGSTDDDAETARKRRRKRVGESFLKRNRERRDRSFNDPDAF